jgi:hypothetical protein
MEEIFFFRYHLSTSREEWGRMQVAERRFLMERFIEQKNMEQEELEKNKK